MTPHSTAAPASAPTPAPSAADITDWQQRLGSQANNRAWALAEQPQRSAADNETMLQAAHAAGYLWGLVGTEIQRARASLLLAQVHALLQMPDRARHHLDRDLDEFRSEPLADWEVPRYSARCR